MNVINWSLKSLEYRLGLNNREEKIKKLKGFSFMGLPPEGDSTVILHYCKSSDTVLGNRSFTIGGTGD